MARKTIDKLKSQTPKTRICSFVVYGKAAPAGSKTAFVGKGGKAFVRDSSKGSYAWKDKVSDRAAEVFGNTRCREHGDWLPIEGEDFSVKGSIDV